MRWSSSPIVVLALAGCSLASVNVPQTFNPHDQLDCDSASPVADAVGASLLFLVASLATLDALTSDANEPSFLGNEGQLVLLGAAPAAMGLIYTASAIYGSRAIARCRGFEEQLAAYEREREKSAQMKSAQPWLEWAARSAKYGDCEKVKELADKVHELGPEAYRALVSNVAVTRCLFAPTAPSPLLDEPSPEQPQPPSGGAP